MVKYRYMLRQVLVGTISVNRIAQQHGMSHHTVRRAKGIALEAGLTLAALDVMDDCQLSALLRPKQRGGAQFDIPDWEAETALMRKGANRLHAYTLYADRAGSRAMSYRTYCHKLQDYQRKLDPVLRIGHVAGYALQTDYAGYMPPARDHDGTQRNFKLFVACLPLSRLMAASIGRSERVVEHIEANIAALEYIGGSPTIMVPDNLKPAVISRRGGSVRLQDSYQAFVDHYGIGVVPARPRQPQDKAAVENAVKLIQRSLRMRFINRPVPTIDELKVALAEIVDDWNVKPMRRANGHSRRSLFEQEERMHLKPLRRDRFECFEAIKTYRVGKDYHVPYKGSHYSVPVDHIGRDALIKAKATAVLVFVNGIQVAVHPRLHEDGATSTNPAHRPPNHAGYASTDLVEWAARFTESVRSLAATEMGLPCKPQMRSRRSTWIKDLPRIHSRQRFIAACDRAVMLDDLRFEHVENVLKRGIEQAPQAEPVTAPIKPVRNMRPATDFAAGGSRRAQG
jgi:transposase